MWWTSRGEKGVDPFRPLTCWREGWTSERYRGQPVFHREGLQLSRRINLSRYDLPGGGMLINIITAKVGFWTSNGSLAEADEIHRKVC